MSLDIYAGKIEGPPIKRGPAIPLTIYAGKIKGPEIFKKYKYLIGITCSNEGCQNLIGDESWIFAIGDLRTCTCTFNCMNQNDGHNVIVVNELPKIDFESE